ILLDLKSSIKKKFVFEFFDKINANMIPTSYYVYFKYYPFVTTVQNQKFTSTRDLLPTQSFAHAKLVAQVNCLLVRNLKFMSALLFLQEFADKIDNYGSNF
ncbi:MAG: hypothetical protein ACI4MA_02435, partial [Treponema sp.]